MKSRIILVATILSVAAPAALADTQDCTLVQTPKQKKDEGTLKRIELDWLTAEYRGNTLYLDCLLTSDYKVIAPNEKSIQTKSDLLARVDKNKGITSDIPLIETMAIINRDSATVTSIVRAHKKNGDPLEYRVVDFYVFIGKAWYAVGGVDLY